MSISGVTIFDILSLKVSFSGAQMIQIFKFSCRYLSIWCQKVDGAAINVAYDDVYAQRGWVFDCAGWRLSKILNLE